MADIKATAKATIKKYSTFSLILAIVLINIWLLNNGERVLPPDIYTQNVSIIYGIILAVIMGIWFITLYAEKRTHIITELYQISIRDSLIGMVLGTTLVLMVFWVVFGAILGETPRDLGWEGYVALIVLHGFIVAPIETITAQKMIVDIVGYVPAAIFFAGMHAAVYGFSAGTLLFAFTMGYIWSRMIGLKTEKWYYGMAGMGAVIATHATYNIATIVYQAKMLAILSFAGPYTWPILLLLLGTVILFEVMHIKSERVVVRMEERTCEICGTVLTYHQKRYCSREHYFEARTGENHPHYNAELHGRICEICDGPLKGYQEKFCSRKCYGRQQSRDQMGENNPTYKPELHGKTCEICGESLNRYQEKYCSKKCYGRMMRGNNNPRWKGGPISISCSYCEGPMTIERGHFNAYDNHFCTDECYRSWYSKTLSGENSPYWRGGLSFEPYGLEFDESLKERIRDRDSHECQYCGIPESELITKLDTHHLNYIKTDNREENLISLCKSCHTRTNYRRYYWEAYFKMKVQEKDSIQSRLHPIPQEE